jgi:hypothetical protein
VELRPQLPETPLRGPVQPSREYLRAMDRKQLILERVDSEGLGRTVVLEGDTRTGWAARDYVDRVLRR